MTLEDRASEFYGYESNQVTVIKVTMLLHWEVCIGAVFFFFFGCAHKLIIS